MDGKRGLGKWVLGGAWGWLVLGLGATWAQMPQYGQYIYRPNPPEVRMPPDPEAILRNTRQGNTLQPVGEGPCCNPCCPQRIIPLPKREGFPEGRRRTLP
jgi:hypothetical protein